MKRSHIEDLCDMADASIGSGDPKDFPKLKRFVKNMRRMLLHLNAAKPILNKRERTALEECVRVACRNQQFSSNMTQDELLALIQRVS
jgi:hypothetical protein